MNIYKVGDNIFNIMKEENKENIYHTQQKLLIAVIFIICTSSILIFNVYGQWDSNNKRIDNDYLNNTFYNITHIYITININGTDLFDELSKSNIGNNVEPNKIYIKKDNIPNDIAEFPTPDDYPYYLKKYQEH